MKPAVVLFSFICLITSCTKDITIRQPEQPPKLVVNCLFNPDSTWKVFVGKSQSLDDTIANPVINDAEVDIIGKDNHIHLTYADSGYYVADQKPKMNIAYTVNVSAPGYDAVEATDSIPPQALISAAKLDTVPTYITPDNLFDNIKANRLSYNITKSGAADAYVQMEYYSYSINGNYYYTITQETIDNFKSFYNNDTIINRAKKLLGIRVVGTAGLEALLKANDLYHYYSYIFEEYAQKDPYDNDQDPDLLDLVHCYTPSIPLYNITNDNFSVFGLINEPTASYSTYIDHNAFGYSNGNVEVEKDIELWTDLYTLSSATYQYKTTYIQHQLNRENPFAEPVQVYNNIKGGYGIFAGYQLQHIRVY